jgi:hypothetical protein
LTAVSAFSARIASDATPVLIGSWATDDLGALLEPESGQELLRATG